MLKTLAQTLEQAWLDRWNQRIEAAMQGLADVQALAGWAELTPDQVTVRGADAAEYIDALLLKGSLFRAQGLRQKSSALLAKVQSQIDGAMIPRPFRLCFELGVDYWIEQDTASALECFLMAERKAQGDIQKLFSSSNVLWCLEDLDLDRADSERKVLELLKGDTEKVLSKHVADLWDAYLLRKNFYQKMIVHDSKGEGLADFFRQWSRSLPYMENTSSLTLNQDYMWQGSYRLRTLARIWIPADQHSTRLSDAIDRLYLWVWLAMAGRPEMTKEKTLYTLESILKDFEFENQSKENLLLFRNALGWMLVLHPAIKSRVESIYDRLAKLSSKNYPVLEAEFDLMLSLSSESPISSDRANLYEAYAAFKKIHRDMNSSLPHLQERLTPIMTKARHYDLIIDQSRGEILLPADGKLVSSKALTQLLSLLVDNETLNTDELDTFEVSNLIYRARKLLGTKALIVRKNTLSRGPAWPKTLVLTDVELPAYQIEKLKPSMVESEVHLQAAKALLPESFRRKDLEKRLVVSKATANRMLENWLQENKLTVSGKAKATVYKWNEEL
jgi:hypothetical protein